MLRSISATRAFSSTAARNLAKAHLLGRIGKFEPKEMKDGRPFVNYSLAVDRYAPSEAAEGQVNVTDWYNISVFDDKHVDFFLKHMRAGAQLYVEADIKQRAVQDEEGGRQIFTTMTQSRYEVVRFPKKKEEDTKE